MQGGFGCDMQHLIGLHLGPAVVGETGDRLTRTLIATGEAVDVVRQLVSREQMSTSHDAARSTRSILASRTVLTAAHQERLAAAWQELQLFDGKQIEFAWLDAAQVAVSMR
jgi:class 3 adenylate cyclase